MFRGGRKRTTDTYVACTRHLEKTLDKWLFSEGAGTYKDVRKLILMKHFTNIADKDIGL